MMAVQAEDFQTESQNIFGYDYIHEKMKPLRELFLYAKKALIYRCNSGEKAVATIGQCNIQAVYGGTRGNDIKIVISKNVNIVLNCSINSKLVHEFGKSRIRKYARVFKHCS